MSAEYPYDAVKSILLAGASSTKAQGEILVTWDIISPYFVSAANSLSIDIATSVPRGTFLCNWNFTQREAAVVINTIKELKCTCFFIVPIPSVYGFPENIQETMDEIISDGLDKIRLSCMTGDRNFLRDAVLPPYFAVHTTSKNMECVQRFKNIALHNVFENETLTEDTAAGTLGKAEREIESLWKRIGVYKA